MHSFLRWMLVFSCALPLALSQCQGVSQTSPDSADAIPAGASGAEVEPGRCAHILFCLYNQEAMASDPAGIHKYSEDLLKLILPPDVGAAYGDALATRLAQAEQLARSGRGKLVPETAVARAFNELMKTIGAPGSLRTEDASLHAFRAHAASIKAFGALFSASRNGADCNPGEAVFLLHLLISNSGTLFERNLDSEQAMMQADDTQTGDGYNYGVAHMAVWGLSASDLLAEYLTHHDPNATIALYDSAAGALGF